MSGRVPREMLRKLRKLSGEEMFGYLRNIYAEGFQDGLREGESEYDDASSQKTKRGTGSRTRASCG